MNRLSEVLGALLSALGGLSLIVCFYLPFVWLFSEAS